MSCRGASLYEKLLLKGVLTNFKRTGLEETTFNKECDQFKVICGTEGEWSCIDMHIIEP